MCFFFVKKVISEVNFKQDKYLLLRCLLFIIVSVLRILLAQTGTFYLSNIDFIIIVIYIHAIIININTNIDININISIDIIILISILILTLRSILIYHHSLLLLLSSTFI